MTQHYETRIYAIHLNAHVVEILALLDKDTAPRGGFRNFSKEGGGVRIWLGLWTTVVQYERKKRRGKEGVDFGVTKMRVMRR